VHTERRGNIRGLSNIIESASEDDLPLLKRDVAVRNGNGLKIEVNNGFAKIEEIIAEAIKMYGNIPNDEIAKNWAQHEKFLKQG
jgi:hypothetical protein